MTMLHDPAVRARLETRLGTLRPDSQARWGRMTVSQMLWHCNQAIAAQLGEVTLDRSRIPIPKSILKFVVLRMPWSRNAPTNPTLVAREEYDFEAERVRCRRLIADLSARPLTSPDIQHEVFGRMTTRECSRLSAKHLDHHLKQFGAD